MKIVIAGALEVGTHLARLLAKENMDVVLMDADAERISQLTFFDLMTLVGSPTSISALKEAGVPHCDLFIAVTPIESVNIHACILATNLGARKTIARIDSYELQKPESAEFYKRLGISRLLYPEMLAGQAIAAAIERPWARQSYSLCEDSLLLLAVKVEADAPLVGQRMMDIGKRHHDSFHIAAIRRKNDSLVIPSGPDVIMEGDLVYFITLPHRADLVRLCCGKKKRHLNRVIIQGSGRLAIQTCYYLPKDYEILFIVRESHEADYVMEKVPKAHVVHGQKVDLETLSDLHISENDAFVSVGPDSAGNILACLTAKQHGVGKTVVEVGDIEQIALASNLNIGSTVNKKLLTASVIYQLMLDADKTNAKCFSLIEAELAELVAQPGSRITAAPVMHLTLPHGLTLGGLVRNGKGQTVTGQTQIAPGDHVVVVCMNDRIDQIERYFVKA